MDSGESHGQTNGGSSLCMLSKSIDAVLATGLMPESAAGAARTMAELESVSRRVHAAQVELMSQIDQMGLHSDDGHSSVKAQARHVGALSNSEALNRHKSMRMLAQLTKVKAEFWAGRVGTDQVHLLARVHANQRVAAATVLCEEVLLDQATGQSYPMFEVFMRQWERLVDQDGAEPDGERTHRRRTARMSQDPVDLTWGLVAKFAALQGAAMNEVLEHYVQAEWQADWEKAVANHGDQATMADMPRTDAQRRADALWQIFQDAAAADGSAVPVGFTHNIVWSADTFEEMVNRMGGDEPTPHDPDTFVCRTVNGLPLEPNEAFSNAVLHAFRRVVIDAQGIVLDMGRRRLFGGNLKEAIQVASNGHCVWAGCQVPVTRCETDHLLEHSRHGRTNPGNGAPLCGKHNRWKQKGFTVWRDPTGEWRTTRPDGTHV